MTQSKQSVDISVLSAEYASGISASQLAKKYATSTTAIMRRLKAAGAVLRDPKQCNVGTPSTLRLFDDPSELVAEYTSGQSSTVLAEKYGTSRNVITSTLKRAGVSIRNASERLKGRPSSKRLIKDTTQLVAEYQAGHSTVDLAAKYGTSATVINGTLKRAGVTLRSLSEAHEFRDTSGKNNPNFQGKGKYAADGTWLNEMSNGYLRRRMPEHPLAFNDGWVAEHVYQACMAYGVDAVRDNELHHIDKDTWNNKPDNLMILTEDEHVYIENLYKLNGRILTREEITSVLQTRHEQAA